MSSSSLRPVPLRPTEVSIEPRMPFLDGLRGLAISLVVSYHAYVRWPELVPYHGRFRSFPLFSEGWLGLPLFFILSGYLIARTLSRCRSIAEFCVRRWSRLFPAMVMCSLLLYLSAPLFPERPAGTPDLWSLLPGLTFIDDVWWSKILGRPIHALEGSFWTLYTEAKFYVSAAFLYFFFGRRALSLGLSAAFFFAAIIWLLVHPLGMTSLARFEKVVIELSLLHFGWFAAGSLWFFYAHEQQKQRWLDVLAWLLCAVSGIVSSELVPKDMLSALLVPILFVLALRNPTAQRVLGHPILHLLGLVSYPLLLLHENVMLALLVKLGPHVPPQWTPLLPIPIVLGLVLVAYPIAIYLAPPAELFLRTKLFTPRVG